MKLRITVQLATTCTKGDLQTRIRLRTNRPTMSVTGNHNRCVILQQANATDTHDNRRQVNVHKGLTSHRHSLFNPTHFHRGRTISLIRQGPATRIQRYGTTLPVTAMNNSSRLRGGLILQCQRRLPLTRRPPN